MAECIYCKAPVSEGLKFCCQSCEFLSTWMTRGETPLQQIESKTGHAVAAHSKWQKYNIEALEKEFNFSKKNSVKKFRFYIEGLQCSSCVHLIEDLPQYCDQVLNSRLNYSKRLLEAEVSSGFGLGDLCQVIEELGYIPSPLKESSDYERASQIENRNELKRIGVGGAIAGNLMLFSIPIYAGLIGELGQIFKWISFFLFLPILFYSATPFYRKAWTSLLVRRINVDMMIVVALWAGFIFSSYSLIRGSDDLYFDSTASFIFLILLTRYWLKQHQDKMIQKNIIADLFEKDVYEVLEEGQNLFLTFNKLQPGMKVQLNTNQLIPCDSILSSADCDLDLSFLTGEAYPQKKHQGDQVLAGSRLVSKKAVIEILNLAVNSQLASSLNHLDQIHDTKNRFQTITDIAAHRLTLVVFSVAGLFFLFTYQELGFESFKRCLALITIACPCAVAFGTPLAHNLGLRKASLKGFFIKSENVFEKLNQIKKVIFDKTGTLTSPDLKLMGGFPPRLSGEHKSIILGLEKDSLHPVALSLKKAWQGHEVFSISNVFEIPGLGVEADYNGKKYRLIKANADIGGSQIQVDFTEDGHRICYLFFEETLLPEAQAVIRDFYDMNFDVMMLSGDRRGRAIDIAKKLHIRPAHVFSEQSAESKKEIIQQQSPCLFVGDGLNDLPALSQAHVSFAIKGSFESTLQVSDIYAPKKNLNSVFEIFKISEQVHKAVKANLSFALLYNFIGGGLALSGLINPLMAAILMPMSSFLITLHTAWRLK